MTEETILVLFIVVIASQKTKDSLLLPVQMIKENSQRQMSSISVFQTGNLTVSHLIILILKFLIMMFTISLNVKKIKNKFQNNSLTNHSYIYQCYLKTS